jgi:predicted component of type VI protein secretion system
MKRKINKMIVEEIKKVLKERRESINEAPSRSAIEKQIADIDKQIDTETGGFGEPLTDETLQALEVERERLEGLLATANESKMSRARLESIIKEEVSKAFNK